VTPIIDVKDVTSMSEQQRVHLRRETVTSIFQSFSLLPGLSAAENVGVPLRIAGMVPKAREDRVATMLTLVGWPATPGTGQESSRSPPGSWTPIPASRSCA
jgi:putative ABC transport system ATP-binding protein